MRNIIISRVLGSEYLARIKMEVYNWGISSAFLSGLSPDINKATIFAKEKVLDAFDKDPLKQHCFEIDATDIGSVGRAWLTDKSVVGKSESELRLCYIKIDEIHQRKGLGREAISLLEDYGHQNGFTTMSLNVFSHLPHAAALYQAMGYDVVDQLKFGDNLIATEMKKTINPTISCQAKCKPPVKF